MAEGRAVTTRELWDCFPPIWHVITRRSLGRKQGAGVQVTRTQQEGAGLRPPWPPWMSVGGQA